MRIKGNAKMRAAVVAAGATDERAKAAATYIGELPSEVQIIR